MKCNILKGMCLEFISLVTKYREGKAIEMMVLPGSMRIFSTAHEKAKSLSSLSVFFTVSVNSMYWKSLLFIQASIEQFGGSQA